jgi:hypothetical protein
MVPFHKTRNDTLYQMLQHIVIWSQVKTNKFLLAINFLLSTSNFGYLIYSLVALRKCHATSEDVIIM